jgi:hypothetical protein
MSFYLLCFLLQCKDVYFMSTAATELKWVKKERRVYNKEAKKLVTMKFLQSKIVDDYNNGMNKVDQADQLRSTHVRICSGGTELCKMYSRDLITVQ